MFLYDAWHSVVYDGEGSISFDQCEINMQVAEHSADTVVLRKNQYDTEFDKVGPFGEDRSNEKQNILLKDTIHH